MVNSSTGFDLIFIEPGHSRNLSGLAVGQTAALGEEKEKIGRTVRVAKGIQQPAGSEVQRE